MVKQLLTIYSLSFLRFLTTKYILSVVSHGKALICYGSAARLFGFKSTYGTKSSFLVVKGAFRQY